VNLSNGKIVYRQSHDGGGSDDERPKMWYLLYSMDTIRRKMSVVSLKIENYDILVGDMRKEAQEWLETLSLKKLETDAKYISQGAQAISLREIISPSTPAKIHNSILDENEASFEESEKNHRKSVKFTINQSSLSSKDIRSEEINPAGTDVSQLRERVVELVKQGISPLEWAHLKLEDFVEGVIATALAAVSLGIFVRIVWNAWDRFIEWLVQNGFNPWIEYVLGVILFMIAIWLGLIKLKKLNLKKILR
jgi:hypothetical protein